ncbi:prepilin-type N-terminal cleavage/methylation domain-containing protein [Elusimicrobium posterum]|uniref:type IV pilin protein n=1 Tax=Elusimicrobium posterum TaxID=3116653 RepID=UPI003C78F0E7
MKKGFTLIELLVVVLIIGILASIALPQYTKAVEKSRSAETLIVLKNIMDAGNRYYLANGTYVPEGASYLTFEDLDIDFPNASMSAMGSKNFNYTISSSLHYLTATAKRADAHLSSTKNVTISFRSYDGKEEWRQCTDNNGYKNCKALFATNYCGPSHCTF